MNSLAHPKVTKTATLIVFFTFVASLFSRNMGEYFFDFTILFILFVTAQNKAPWSFRSIFYKTGFNALLWLFYAWLFVTILGNPPIKMDSLKLMIEFLWIPLLFVYARVFDLWAPTENWIKFLCITVTLIMVGILFQYFKYPEYGGHWGLPNRLRGPFTNTNFLAHAYFIVFILLWGVFVQSIHDKRKTLAVYVGVAASFVLTALILTFTRSIWIALILTSPLSLFFIKPKASFVTFATLVTAFALLYALDFGGTKERLNESLTPEKTYDAGRLTLWRTNLKIFKDNPVLGVGYMNNKRDITSYYKKYNETEHTLDTHAHSELISFLAGTGIVGTFLYLSLFAMFFRLGIKTYNKMTPVNNSVKRGLLLGCISIQPGFIIAGVADNNFEIHIARNWLIITWALIIWLASENQVHINLFRNRLRQS